MALRMGEVWHSGADGMVMWLTWEGRESPLPQRLLQKWIPIRA